jgi:S1 RNA binding domain protein
VEGVVRATTSYGAFVSLPEYGCDGLIHISELTNRFLARVEDRVRTGDVVMVKVLRIDDRGRVGLSLRKAELSGNARKVELGGDWEASWADLGPRPKRTHYPWEPDPRLFTFDHASLKDVEDRAEHEPDTMGDSRAS